jgi:hypothetical protein
LKRIVLWAAAAVAALLALELLFFLSLTPSTPRARLLGLLPDAVEARYVDFILGEGDGYFRNPPRKCGMIELLEAAQRAGIRLSYDPAALIPYAGQRAVRAYDQPCIEEPTRIRAGRLLYATGDPGLVRRGFAAHSGDPESVNYLCIAFDEATLRFPGYARMVRSRCSPENTRAEVWRAVAATALLSRRPGIEVSAPSPSP